MFAPAWTSENLRFFRAWIANPLRVASVLPSSTSLSLLITKEISADTGPVIELGPGTGVFTRALLTRGVAEQDIVLVESGPEFIGRLRTLFPSASVLQMDAAKLGAVRLRNDMDVGAVISGLPFLSMSLRKVLAILSGSFRKLRPNGAFYLFTYGYACPIPRRVLDHLGLKVIRLGGTFSNFPPAFVYRIKRRSRSPHIVTKKTMQTID